MEPLLEQRKKKMPALIKQIKKQPRKGGSGGGSFGNFGDIEPPDVSDLVADINDMLTQSGRTLDGISRVKVEFRERGCGC